jgi:uncharacterized protein (DUF2147 family)
VRFALIALLFFIPNPSGAQPLSPAGLWKTYSDRTGEADGLVRIREVNGEFQGTVEAVFSPPAQSANPLCEECPGALRNTPVVGMTILRGLRWDGEQYSGGQILDPDSGTVYRCTAKLSAAGRKLEIRGFVGIPFFGRTQIWERQD